METRARNKWQIRLAVIIIFVIGAIAGALAMNLYHARHWSPSSARMGGRFDRIFNQLNLTPEQSDQVKAIFDDARAKLAEIRKESEPGFREVRRQTDDRLQAVLTPDQWQQFKQMMNESRGRRHFGRDKKEGQQ